MTPSQRFGDIRSLIEQGPSEMAFDLICQHVELAAEEAGAPIQEVWLTYLKEKLDTWPDAARLCPSHLLDTFERGESLWGELVRALDFSGSSLSRERVDALLALPDIASITRLDLRSTNMPWELLADFVARAPFQLEHFAFRRVSAIDRAVLIQLFSSPMLAALTSLNLRGWDKISSEVFELMLERLPLERLRTLDVSGGVVSAKRLKQLLDSGKLDQLEVLLIDPWTSQKACAGVIDVLARRPQLTALKTLHVPEMKSKETRALAKATHLATLRELHIGHLDDAAALEGLRDAPFTALESCRLGLPHRLTASQAALTASLPWLATLRRLQLTVGWETAEDVSLTPLLESEHFPKQLEHFAIDISDPSQLAELARAPHLAGLVELHIALDTPYGSEEALRAFFDAPLWRELDTLALGASRASSRVIPPLLRSSLMGRLRQLRLSVQAPAEQLDALFVAEGLEKLETLSLWDDYMLTSGRHLPLLSTSPRTARLRRVDLNHEATAAALRHMMARPESTLPQPLHIHTPEVITAQRLDWL